MRGTARRLDSVIAALWVGRVWSTPRLHPAIPAVPSLSLQSPTSPAPCVLASGLPAAEGGVDEAAHIHTSQHTHHLPPPPPRRVFLGFSLRLRLPSLSSSLHTFRITNALCSRDPSTGKHPHHVPPNDSEACNKRRPQYNITTLGSAVGHNKPGLRLEVSHHVLPGRRHRRYLQSYPTPSTSLLSNLQVLRATLRVVSPRSKSGISSGISHNTLRIY